MNVRVSLCLLVGAGLLNAGCRLSPDVRAHIDTVNSENRLLEDRIYDLQYELQIAYDKLDRLEGKTTSGSSTVSTGTDRPPAKKKTPSSDSSPSRSKLELPELPAPSIDSGKKSSSSPKNDLDLDFGAPQIDLGEPVKKPMVPAPDDTLKPPGSRSSSSRFETPAFGPPRNVSLPEPPPTVDADSREIPVSTTVDDQITQLYLNPFLTGSSDFDNKPGDDGLTVVVEPRNSKGEYVPQAGPISVALLDSTKEGESARVARWDFNAVDAGRFLKNQSKGPGLHLQMTWPGKLPESSRLRLFVRYETSDHRYLQAEQEVFITLPEQLSQRWTPKTRRGPTITNNPATEPPLAPAVEFSTPETVSVPIVLEPPAEASASAPGTQSATQPRPIWKPQR